MSSETIPVQLDCGQVVAEREQTHYCSYIAVARLESLITPHDPEGQIRATKHHDELQFVAVHQICEISFVLILTELRHVISSIKTGKYAEACTTLNRVVKWLGTVTKVTVMLDTMTRKDFMKIREFLLPASGAESVNFRYIEILSGLRADSPYATFGPDTFTFKQSLTRGPVPKSAEGIKTRWWKDEFDTLTQENSLRSVFEQALSNDVIEEVLAKASHPLHALSKLLMRYETVFLTLRRAHTLTAAKAIGRIKGSAGTEGVAYLIAVHNTARFFPMLPVRVEDITMDMMPA